MTDDEFAFANDVRAALAQRPPRSAWFLILTVLLTLAAGVAWAGWAVVEETTSGAGRVIPSTQLQVVQAVESGIVRQILIEEGSVVEPGQVLMHVDDTSAASQLGELAQRRYALLAEASRLQAEAEALDEPVFDSALGTNAPGAVDAETAAFRARRGQLDEEIAVLEQQKVQREQERDELDVREAQIVAALQPLERELTLTRSLHQRGVIPEIELLRLERQTEEQRGELAVVRAAKPRAAAAIQEARSLLANKRATFQAEAREKMARTASDLAVIEESMRAARDRVQRTSLRAPVRGVVNTLTVTTIGAVVQPGQSLVEIVPIDDALLIEAEVRPQDVAFIRPKQPASVKLTAYDYRVYGALSGTVERISADTITNVEGETVYRVIVRTGETHIQEGDQELPVIPGMVATVDIQTGEKTVLDYLLNPIVRIRSEALRER